MRNVARYSVGEQLAPHLALILTYLLVEEHGHENNLGIATFDPGHGPEPERSVMTKQVEALPQTKLWAVILEGEDGTSLQAGAPGSQENDPSRPLQPASGFDSLLRQTWSRTRLAVPQEQIVIVSNRSHEACLASELPVPETPRLVLRPRHRGTAADALLALHWIRRQEPSAVVAVLPSEQVVLEPVAFMQHVVRVALFVERNWREIVIVGARPTSPDTRYGWIETGQRIADAGYEPVWRVRSLRGSLSYPLARACYESGSLWNTFVIVARAETLLQASRRFLPELDTRLETLAMLVGTSYEQRSLEEFYSVEAKTTFSEAVLAGAPRVLSASRLPPIYWSGRADPWTASPCGGTARAIKPEDIVARTPDAGVGIRAIEASEH